MYGIPEAWGGGSIVHPYWLGHERLHASHRAALKASDPAWYAYHCWTEPPVIDWWWPGRIPKAGEYLVHSTSGVVALVMFVSATDVGCLEESSGAQLTIPKRDVATRIWKNAQRGA